MSLSRLALAAVCVVALVACGQKTEKSSTGATDQMVSTAAPGSNAQTTSRSTSAPVPADMKCASGAAPVWANLKSKAFHLAGDDYYGRTEHGRYMCLEDATRLGYHQAGTRHMKPSELNMSPGPAIPAEAPAPSPAGRHHRHHRNATPAPTATGGSAP